MRTIDESLALVQKLLTDRSVTPLETIRMIEECPPSENFDTLYSEIAMIRDILRQFANGDFGVEIKMRGTIAGYLKTLQANLRHLTWQVEQVALGDFSQRVDFMGNFSQAFNTLTTRLEQSVEIQKEREAYERTQIMLDVTPLCCSFWDENMNVVDCNLEAIKLFDLKGKQEYVDRFFDLSPEFQPSGRPSTELAYELIQEAFENERVTFEWVHKKLNGELIPAKITLVRVWQKNHFIVVGYTRDLRKLRQAENALDQERLLLLNILNSSPVCFCILVEDKVQFVTPFMQDFIGTKVGESFIGYLSDKSFAQCLSEDTLEKEAVRWSPVTMQAKNGETKEMLANVFTTEYYGKYGLMVWLVDITEIRKIEADLRKARDVAEDSARIKSEFLANMSHEIRTPMNAILGMMHLVKQTALAEKQLIYVETAEKSAKLLLCIINDILDFSKIEAGRLEMESSMFSLQMAIEEVIAVVDESVDKKNLILSYQIDDAIPEWMLGDAIRLKQVLLNLLNNSIKFTSKGSIRLNVYLENRDETNIFLKFSVRDTGIGMSEKTLQRLFTPFTQADSSMTRKYGGTGLGLSISKSLVEMMHGEIQCESREDIGTIFTFTARFDLPAPKSSTLDQVLESATEEAEKSGVHIPESMRGVSILLTEDNKINQLVATELLKSQGFLVDVAENGKMAVQMVHEKDYDLVLMDIQMPEMDGWQATRLIRQEKRFADLPILAMTANAMAGDRELCLEAGMNDHIAKPILPSNLYRTLIKWINKK